MIVSFLKEYAEAKPARWDAPLYLVSESSEGYRQSCVRNIEIDENDFDVNFVVEEADTKTITLREIRDVLDKEAFQEYPLFCRRFIVPAVEGFTHLDSPVCGISESESGAVGLFW